MNSRAQIRDPAEDWRGVTDVTERKRLQNRLAQRARRAKRLREKRPRPRASATCVSDQTEIAIAPSPSREMLITEASPATQIDLYHGSNSDSIDPVFEGSCLEEQGPLRPSNTALYSLSRSGFEHVLQSPESLSLNAMPAFAACWANAKLLHLKCNDTMMVSQHPSPSTPRALAATSLQMSIAHRPFVDTLPFPSMRDKILSASWVIDEDDLCNDLLGEQVRCWSRFPWDGKGWELPPRFVDKWWFLMDEDVIDSTNFWRRERGEPELVWRGRRPDISKIMDVGL